MKRKWMVTQDLEGEELAKELRGLTADEWKLLAVNTYRDRGNTFHAIVAYKDCYPSEEKTDEA